MNLPLPPHDLRVLVGPTDDQDFDNPGGTPIYPNLPAAAYRSVFDFGCGCGRLARKLIQQTPRPERYIGVDPHRSLVDWASAHLTPASPGFTFHHHDVYSPGYAPGNSLQLSERFPADSGQVSLAIAHSVFTHLSLDQTEYYLSEFVRILAPDGVAFTTWFLFDNASMPFFKLGPFALYADEKDFSAAVIYDRHWLLDAFRRHGLTVTSVKPPNVPGHQWEIWLAKRTSQSVDQFPLGEQAAEFVCGATVKPMANVTVNPQEYLAGKTGSRTGAIPERAAHRVVEPPLYGALADLVAARQEIELWKKRAILWRAYHKVKRMLGLAR